MDIARRMVHPTLTGLPRKDQNRERARPREKQSRGGTSCPRTIGRSIQTRRATHRFALAQRRPLASSRLRQTYQPFEPSRTPRLCRDPRCRKIPMRGIHHEDDRGAHSIRRLDVRQLSARVRLFSSPQEEYATLLPFVRHGLDTPSPSSVACYTRTHSSSRRRSYCVRSCNAAARDPRHTGDDAGPHTVRDVSAWHGAVSTSDGLTLGR